MAQDDDPQKESTALLRRLLAERPAGPLISDEEGRARTLAMLDRFQGRLISAERLSRDEANKR